LSKRKIEIARRRNGEVRKPRNIEVEIAVVVVVHQQESKRKTVDMNTGGHGDILERSVAQIAIESDVILESHHEVVESIVVVVPYGTSQRFTGAIEPGASSHVGELPTARISIKNDAARTSR